MLVNVNGAKCVGIDAVPVTVEVEVTGGIGLHLVGLADTAVRESLLRTVTALQAKGFRIPGKKIVINLAPADLHKQGSGYDLPIALGIIAASEQRNLPGLEKYLIMGELGLDGSIRTVAGALPMVEMAVREGRSGCILPEQSALEAVDWQEAAVFGVRTLDDVLRILEEEDDPSDLLIWNTAAYREAQQAEADGGEQTDYMDFADILGQESAKRGVEIAAAGGHNLLFLGSPGSGKSSMAKAVAGILPPMTRAEALVTSKVYSVAGRSSGQLGLLRRRPFRAPHISASKAAILGGGSGENILPGEVSLASGGVLFADEFCEAPKATLEALRGPLEDRKVTISRLKAKIVYPASFMLIAASNPCPCGYYGEGDRCTCSVSQRTLYLSKLSGPIMDRIDIQLWVRAVPTAALIHGRKGEPSAAIAARVRAARAIQQRRFAGRGIYTNAEMSGRDLEQFCPLSDACKATLEKIIDRLGLSARAYTRIIKIARTIADLRAATATLPGTGALTAPATAAATGPGTGGLTAPATGAAIGPGTGGLTAPPAPGLTATLPSEMTSGTPSAPDTATIAGEPPSGTPAAPDPAGPILPADILEAASYRFLDRKNLPEL